jgi:hypothetical protein
MKMIIAARVDTLVQMETDLNVDLPNYVTSRVATRFPRSCSNSSHLEIIQQDQLG